MIFCLLEQFVARYIDHVSPENPVNHSSGSGSGTGLNAGHANNSGQGPDGSGQPRTHDVASEILAIGPIQVEGINLDQSGSGTGSGPVTDMHEIKVEDTGPNEHDLKNHHGHHPGHGPRGPAENIMVELGDADSEMLLVK